MSESINDTDEADLLGYYESIIACFLTKLTLLASIIGEKDGCKVLKFPFDASAVIEEFKKSFDEPVFFKALERGNEELILNLQDDLISGVVIQSWSVFEQILKSLDTENYALSSNNLNVNYQRSTYQFTSREKKDIELFYYIRNAIVHYNGAYYSYRNIDHRYQGIDFKSSGNEGQKMIMSPKVVYSLIKDLEQYTIKAWQNAKQL